MGYLEKLILRADSHLFEQGKVAESLYLVENGQVSTYQGAPPLLHGVAEHSMWLETFGSGTLAGAVDFLTQPHYTRSAWVTQAGVAYRLTRDQLLLMETQDPLAALAFQKYVNGLLAQQLGQTFSELTRLLD